VARNQRIPDRGDVAPSVVAQRLGLSLTDFNRWRPELEARGFPMPDPTTGQFCIEAVDWWRLRRYPVDLGAKARGKAVWLTKAKPSIVPSGSWPRRMPADLAAGYCGEKSVQAFMKRVGSEYPQPRVNDGQRKLWLRDDLDQAILPPDLANVRDLAEDL
jgi:hypothetical protein